MKTILEDDKSLVPFQLDSGESILVAEHSMPLIMGTYIDNDLCDELIRYYEHPWNIKTESGMERKLVTRSGSQCFLEGTLFERYVSQIHEVYKLYIQKFPHIKDLSGPHGLTEKIKLQKTLHPNQSFHSLHYESSDSNVSNRFLVFMTYLNDVDDGGETYFPNQNLKVSPKKGLTLFWPAGVDYPHKGLTSNTQTKYIATGWISFLIPPLTPPQNV